MNIDWQSVVLLLGIVGMAFATVCFTIWVMGREDEFTPADEQPTKTWQVPGGK